jgi:signal transduction histidine kinase
METVDYPVSLLRSRWRGAVAVIVGVIALTFDVSGLLTSLERFLLEARFALQERQASPSLVLVEVDAASIDQIGYWPLPRSTYAKAIDRLLNAEIETVAIDLDFSSRSLGPEDEALEKTVRRWGNQVVLATYGQRASTLEETSAVINHPIAPLDSLAELATVNVFPDSDGRVWRYPVGQWVGRDFKAAIAVILAGTGSFKANNFLVDYSIDPRSIPRIRLADLTENGALPPPGATRAIIGTTAIDAGDRLTVPVYGNISGVELQAIAYSSIVSGRMLQSTGMPVTVAGLSLLMVLCHYLIGRPWWQASIALLGVASGIFGGALAIQWALPVAVDIAAWLVALAMWLLVTLVGRLEEQGRAIAHQHAQGVLRDALLRTVVEENFDGVLITDTEEKIEWLSPAGARLLNQPARKLIGASLVDHVPLFALLGTETDGTTVIRREIEHRIDEGDPLILEVVVGTTHVSLPSRGFRTAPIDQIFRTYIFQDVSQRRRAEEAQRSALEERERIQRAKAEFLSNMSHELRTPLNAIIGFSDVIASEQMGPVGTPAYKEYAGLIGESGTMLLEVINTILEVSRVDAGMLRISDGDVNLADVAHWCSQLAPGFERGGNRSVDVVIEDGVPILVGDELLVRQTVINLLSNAYKFTEADGKISVRIGTASTGRAYIEVADDGIGIDQEHLTQLFQAFYQVEGAFARRHGGSGLGLYLVRRYADLHDAEIKVKSEPGKGTTIRIIFPLERCRVPDKKIPAED